MCDPCTPEALLEAVRGLRVADPGLGFKPLLAKLRERQPDLGAATKEVREALTALKAETAESEAKAAAALVQAVTAAAPPAADEEDVPLHPALVWREAFLLKLEALRAKSEGIDKEIDAALKKKGSAGVRALTVLAAKHEVNRAEIEALQAENEAAKDDEREAVTALKAESEALTALLKAESEAKAAAALAHAVNAATPPVADEGVSPAANEGNAPSHAALSLACIGCARLPSDMDDEREKHPICDMCRDEKLPTTYQCGVNCPAGPGAWKLHGAFHKKLRKGRKAFPLSWENDVLVQQAHRELAEKLARNAAQTGDKYDELLAEGVRYASKKDWRRSARACREAIALRPDGPAAHYHLACVLSNSGHHVEAVQRHLEAKERYPVGSEGWAVATANSFDKLLDEECSEVAKPEWWNDKALKVLSAIVVRAAPDNTTALRMRATVLAQQAFPGYSHGYSPNGKSPWVAGPRSAAELREAAVYWDRAAALMDTTSMKDKLASLADGCRSMAQLSAKLAKQSAAITAKEASIEAAKKAEAEKKAEKDRTMAERLEQFRNVRIGEAITSGK